MLSFRHLLLAAALIAPFAGCTTVSDPTTDDDYLPPTASSSAATLKGSRITEGGMFGDTHTGYVYMIDLKAVRDAAEQWDRPIVLAAGKRSIMAEYHFSNFKARSTLALTAMPGAAYQLMIKAGRENTPQGRLTCDFWIIDLATGAIVSPIHHAQVTGGKKGTIFYIPS